ncbi:AraC family transcriptional regulator [Agathobacter rectalis]|uniref:AraC family transcriptional regulator n=2 Tax=Agathobacter rectalis TaxID=39491 RepID=A0A415IJM0_9FIRM|nr:AraC family transcriptional regulator [Agathobacter rectalis]RHL07847.1 AraC family transcriptional regulator [Agathobacter rectalis]
MDSGFGSLRTFNRVFKEKYRLTPSEYRNKLQDG